MEISLLVFEYYHNVVFIFLYIFILYTFFFVMYLLAIHKKI